MRVETRVDTTTATRKKTMNATMSPATANRSTAPIGGSDIENARVAAAAVM